MTQNATPENEPAHVDAVDSLRRARIVEHLKARNWASLVAMMERDEGEITEESEAVEAVLEELSAEHLELLGEAYLGLMAWVDTLKSEEARIRARRARFEALAAKIPAMVKIAKKVETPLVTFRVSTSSKWQPVEGEDVTPAQFANPAFVEHVPESWKLKATALKKAVLDARSAAEKIEKGRARKKPVEPTAEQLAELAKLEKLATEAQAFGTVITSKSVSITRSS